jgi:hypothetical protein
MLKVGRHIRPNQRFKLIVAREESEVHFLEGYRNQYANIYPISCTGPLALIEGEPTQEDLKIAAGVIARYSKDKNEESVTLEVKLNSGISQQISIKPLGIDDIPQSWII